MNSEKVKEIKKALKCCSEGKCEKCLIGKKDIRKCVDILLKDTLTLINELENENENLKINMQETENLSFQINQMNGNLIIENQKLKDRIAELEEENGELKEHVTEVEKGIINIAKERNKKDELASKFIDSYNDSLKQFAEKLKEKALSHCRTINCYELKFIETTIDELLDEILKEYLDER